MTARPSASRRQVISVDGLNGFGRASRLAATAGGLDENGEVGAGFGLADELGQRLRAQGAQLTSDEPYTNAHGRRLVFVHPKSTGGVLALEVEGRWPWQAASGSEGEQSHA